MVPAPLLTPWCSCDRCARPPTSQSPLPQNERAVLPGSRGQLAQHSLIPERHHPRTASLQGHVSIHSPPVVLKYRFTILHSNSLGLMCSEHRFNFAFWKSSISYTTHLPFICNTPSRVWGGSWQSNSLMPLEHV